MQIVMHRSELLAVRHRGGLLAEGVKAPENLLAVGRKAPGSSPITSLPKIIPGRSRVAANYLSRPLRS